MSMFITGLIVGLIVGGVSGIIITALVFASNDKENENGEEI